MENTMLAVWLPLLVVFALVGYWLGVTAHCG